MSDFNYQDYLKNNPLLQGEVKEEKLLTESQEIEETVENTVSEDSVSEGFLDFLKKKKEAAPVKKDDPNPIIGVDYDGNYIRKDGTMAESQEIEETVEENVEEVVEETTEEIQEEVPSSKIKVSELKAKIKEDIISLLQEDEEEEEVEVEDEVEMDMDVEEPSMGAAPAAGLSKDEQEIQDSLKVAYDNAVAIGDQKLADQIGNSITFFTRSHVVER
jgi:hypothetical protein